VILRSKVAIVTGAGRGLGRAYALALSDAGANVVVNDLDGDVAASVVEEIAGRGGEAIVVAGSAADSSVAEEAVRRAVEQFGRLDIVVPNAGVLRDRTLTKLSDEDFDVVIATHLRASSTSFALQSFSSWHRINANAIVPVALTRMVATIPGLGDLVEAVDGGEPIPRHVRRSGMGTPADVAPLVVFLASDQAGGITGQAIGAGGDRIPLGAPPPDVAPKEEVAAR
jgi:3-oxoacyl-[acyl-carrier protein] reductase